MSWAGIGLHTSSLPLNPQRTGRSLDPQAPVPGTVYLVGAGPGDPELITVRGLRCLRHAGVLLYDRLLHPALLDEAPAAAQRIFVGKARDRPGIGQDAIQRLMIKHARLGAVVVRLKGGDPFVFGRGAEEAEALNSAGIPWEVVPAVSSALGVPARAGIPVTHRHLAHGFAVITGHQLDGGEFNWGALASLDTLVVLMGLTHLAALSRRLIAEGRDAETPAAAIARGTLPGERVVVGTLADLPSRVAAQGIKPPATIVVGDVVRLHQTLVAGTVLAEEGRWSPGVSEATLAAETSP